MTVKLLNAFIVPEDQEEAFLAHWKTTAEFFYLGGHGFRGSGTKHLIRERKGPRRINRGFRDIRGRFPFPAGL